LAQVSRRQFGVGALGLLALGVLDACTTNSDSANAPSGSKGSTAGSSTKSTPPPAPPATITLNPANGAANINPAAPISVTAAGGTITSVSLVNGAGAAIGGALSADSLTWTANQPLAYGDSYTVTANAVNTDGVAAAATGTFATLTPGNMTLPYLYNRAGGSIVEGGTYGVGMLIRLRWDEDITDKAAAEQALVVTTNPPVAGSWTWWDDRNMTWRPQEYYAAGTQVSVNLNVFGVQVGDNLFGQENVSTNFVIGSKHVSIADDNTHQVSVYFDDVLQRTMPTSMGRGGYATGSDGQSISFYTPSGTYTVLGQANPVLMDSSTYGLPVDSPLGYKELIYWATQISTDGIYLHELDSTVWAQGNTDTSHGCLNLNGDNATWFYQTAQIGDIVQIQNTGGAPVAQYQGGDWSVDWATWIANSALPH
jgi:lipoprotein-anchoring transpeptidase ErfK/SrfK